MNRSQRWATLLAVLALACESAVTRTAGDSIAGDRRSGDEGTGGDASAGDPNATITPDHIGVYSLLNNYVELDALAAPLRYHFGQTNSRWAVSRWPVAGDWQGAGWDTLGAYDPNRREFLLAFENDSDEWGSGTWTVALTGVPATPPPAVAEGLAQAPIAGDWDGDGIDGVGVFHPGTNTFYLRQEPSSGPVDTTITLGESDGYLLGSWPLAGDWDGDGDDEVGVFDGATVYLRTSLSAGPADLTYAAPGWLVAGDFDGDGVDTLAAFDASTNTFTINDTHTAGLVSGSRTLGHAEAGFWIWWPVVGAWRAPLAPVASDGYDWPQQTPDAHGIDGVALAQALGDGGSLANVLSLLVVRDGTLVGERYYHGYERHIAGNIKSVSKSVLSALVGIAIDRGEIASVDDTVASYLPGYFGAPIDPVKLTITIENILNMRGGLAWSEGGGSVDGLILAPDYVGYVVGQSMATTPGTTYEYSTGLTHLGSALLTAAVGVSSLEYAMMHLLPGLGVSIPRWDASPEGTLIGGAEMWMRPRDMARFGLLYLCGGNLDGQQIVPQSWVESSGNPTVPESYGRLYGLWWRERPWVNYPHDDSFFAWGYGGQFIFLFPSWDLLVVVTSKWNVTSGEADLAYAAIFEFVDNRILTAVTP